MYLKCIPVSCIKFFWCLVICQLSESCLVTDRRVMKKMADLALAGVRRVQEMQRHIQRYVVDELFAGLEAPVMSDARYWPSYKVILNSIYRAVKKTRLVLLLPFTCIDLCIMWEMPEHNFRNGACPEWFDL